MLLWRTDVGAGTWMRCRCKFVVACTGGCRCRVPGPVLVESQPAPKVPGAGAGYRCRVPLPIKVNRHLRCRVPVPVTVLNRHPRCLRVNRHLRCRCRCQFHCAGYLCRYRSESIGTIRAGCRCEVPGAGASQSRPAPKVPGASQSQPAPIVLGAGWRYEVPGAGAGAG